MTARPIRYQRQVSDRKGKIFYTSITSLSHISKVRGLLTLDGLAGGSRTEQAAMVSPRVTSCAINNAPFRVFGKKEGQAASTREG